MASREQRGNKEKKKPKAEWNQKKKGGAAPLPRFGTTAGSNLNIGQPGQNPKR
jgi:hypothetical protein